jgi:4-amino-4-deoxy-L-arabinose transferase-like glycosyltransferase
MDSRSGVREIRSPEHISQWSERLCSAWWIAGIALVLRLAWIFLGHTYRFKTVDNNFSFGWEMGRIGAAIASGHGFSNPFGPATGPTAWEPPLYPYFIAGVFRVFGIYSKASAIVILAANSLCSALTCVPIYLIARRMFSTKVAVISAWAWALLPNVIFWCTRAVWETSFSALLLAVIVWLTLIMGGRQEKSLPCERRVGWGTQWPAWFAFGLLWGVIALNGTSLLAFLPAAGLRAWYRRAKRGKKSFGGVVLASLVFFLTITPWLVRNYKTFGQLIFIRDNFGAELRLGNGEGANGTLMLYLDPMHDPSAMRQFEDMGEISYIAMRKQQAFAYIKADYGRFAGLCLKRFVYFWAGAPRDAVWWLSEAKNLLYLASSLLALGGLGRALRLGKPGAWLLFWLILLYPALYYAVYALPRYRHPIEPEMTILVVFLVTEIGKKATDSSPNQS